MTEFVRDVMECAEMVARGELMSFDVDYYGSYCEIATDNGRRQYDCVSGERIVD